MFPKAVLLIALLVPFATASHDFEETHSEVHPFVSGGTLHIRLSVGEVRITKGADQANLHLRYTICSNRESNLHETQVRLETRGNDSTLEFHSPYRGNTSIEVEIEVPDPTSLDVRVKVGEVHIDGITGDKIVALRIGDIHVGVGDVPDYRVVRARTHIGDVDWRPKGMLANALNYRESGWLGQQLTYNSNGKYELRAEVSIGDIDLR
jgi:hypothetical protein